jgi:hypothetical protein
MAVNSTLDPKDPDFEALVRYSFSKQNVMKTIGAEIFSSPKCEASLIKHNK